MSEDAYREVASAEASELDQGGRDLVMNLSLLLKLAVVHDPSNEALRKPAKGLVKAVERLLGLGQWHLKSAHDHLFINQNRLRLSMEIYPHYVSLVDEMNSRGVGLLSFDRAPSEEEAIRFAFLLQGFHEGAAGLDEFLARLDDNGLQFIILGARIEEGGSRDRGENRRGHIREMVRETFFGAIFLTGGLLRGVEQQKVVNIRRARRVVQSFLDLLALDEDYLVGMTSIKNYDDYTFNHSVNVTILALNMGRYLGLSRSQLSELGLSAIFHDLGKITIPWEIVNKDKPLDDSEWQRMHRHPVEGVKKLLRLKGISDLTVKLIISVYEHHMNYDYSGYPDLPLSKESSLFSRILRIVDSFDAMTTRRVYSRTAKHPAAALEEIWNLAGKNFDPDLVKVFIEMMGMYPVGSMVQLSSGEIAMVVGLRRDVSTGPAPLVEVLADWEGRGEEGRVVDLSGPSAPSIVGYYDFGESRVNPAWHLLGLTDGLEGAGGGRGEA